MHIDVCIVEFHWSWNNSSQIHIVRLWYIYVHVDVVAALANVMLQFFQKLFGFSSIEGMKEKVVDMPSASVLDSHVFVVNLTQLSMQQQ